MTGRTKITVLVALLLIAVISAPGFAQGRRGPFKPHDREGFEKNLENLRLLKLLELLDLNEEQTDKFIAAYSYYRKETDKIDSSIRENTSELADLVREDKASDDELMKRIHEINALRSLRQEERDKMLRKVTEFLTVSQLAKLTVFEERFERELIDVLRQYRAPHGPVNRLYNDSN
jgi:Spy/CpxP family protein refolding chaperone